MLKICFQASPKLHVDRQEKYALPSLVFANLAWLRYQSGNARRKHQRLNEDKPFGAAALCFSQSLHTADSSVRGQSLRRDISQLDPENCLKSSKRRPSWCQLSQHTPSASLAHLAGNTCALPSQLQDVSLRIFGKVLVTCMVLSVLLCEHK